MYVQNFIPVGLFKNFLQLLKVKVALFGTPTLQRYGIYDAGVARVKPVCCTDILSERPTTVMQASHTLVRLNSTFYTTMK